MLVTNFCNKSNILQKNNKNNEKDTTTRLLLSGMNLQQLTAVSK